MCIIAFKPKGVELPSNFYDKVKVMMERNPHGVGIAIKMNDNDTIHILKGLYTADQMIAIIKRKHPGRQDEFLFHARIGTSGKNDGENCHPFFVTSDLFDITREDAYRRFPVLAHNGVFSDYSNSSFTYSDTVMFIKQFLCAPRYNFLFNSAPALFEKVFTNELGHNKLVVMFPDKTKKAYIYNESNFNVVDGIYYSNTGHYLPTEHRNDNKRDIPFAQLNRKNKKDRKSFVEANALWTITNDPVVQKGLKDGWIEHDPNDSGRFLIGINHPLRNYDPKRDEELFLECNNNIWKIAAVYKTGIKIINTVNWYDKWLSPVELLTGYNVRTADMAFVANPVL
jgi:predicted glutamine amidotransferase